MGREWGRACGFRHPTWRLGMMGGPDEPVAVGAHGLDYFGFACGGIWFGPDP